MSSNMTEDKDIRRYIILDHYEKPSHFVEEFKNIDNSYSSFNGNSPSCIDNITAYVKQSNKKITDIKFKGVGCAIATASSDIMADLLIGQTSANANKIIDNYLAMIDKKKYDEKMLGDLFVFSNVNKQISRINCAKVGIIAIKNALNNEKK